MNHQTCIKNIRSPLALGPLDTSWWGRGRPQVVTGAAPRPRARHTPSRGPPGCHTPPTGPGWCQSARTSLSEAQPATPARPLAGWRRQGPEKNEEWISQNSFSWMMLYIFFPSYFHSWSNSSFCWESACTTSQLSMFYTFLHRKVWWFITTTSHVLIWERLYM